MNCTKDKCYLRQKHLWGMWLKCLMISDIFLVSEQLHLM